MLMSDWDESVVEELEECTKKLELIRDDFGSNIKPNEAVAVYEMIKRFKKLAKDWREAYREEC